MALMRSPHLKNSHNPSLLVVDVPGEPTNLQAAVLDPKSIRIWWSPPVDDHGGVSHYKLYYYQVGADEEHDLNVESTDYTLTELEEFHEYSFRVVAYNKNGPGISTEEVVVWTYSDSEYWLVSSLPIR